MIVWQLDLVEGGRYPHTKTRGIFATREEAQAAVDGAEWHGGELDAKPDAQVAFADAGEWWVTPYEVGKFESGD